MRLVRKGPIIEETYAALRNWNMGLSVRDNLANVHSSNMVGAKNEGWLKEIVATLSSIFETEKDVEPLAILAKGRMGIAKWKPCYLWHLGQVDEIYYRFATEWLHQRFVRSVPEIRTGDVAPFIRQITEGRMAGGKSLSDHSVIRSSRDVLRCASAFGLLAGGAVRRFVPYVLPEESFLFILHAVAECTPNPQKIIESPDWRLFLMSPRDVEREIFRLHQYQSLGYEVAGSIAVLSLPCASAREYAERLLA